MCFQTRWSFVVVIALRMQYSTPAAALTSPWAKPLSFMYCITLLTSTSCGTFSDDEIFANIFGGIWPDDTMDGAVRLLKPWNEGKMNAEMVKCVDLNLADTIDKTYEMNTIVILMYGALVIERLPTICLSHISQQ